MSDSQLFHSKSLLAKLLAQENLEVIHRKVPTAYFDLETRSIILPIWKNMDNGILYDLLMGHEVGHALYTPKQGWHDAVLENKSLKTYLNVLEDARIERKMKDKYPGLRRSFNLAYKYLHEQDFFSIANHDVSKMLLIDRINVFYKLGAHINVPFTSDELKYIDRINAAESWEEIEVIARELYGKALEEKKNAPQEEQDLDDEDPEEMDGDFSDQDESFDSSDDSDDYQDEEDWSYDDSDVNSEEDGQSFPSDEESKDSGDWSDDFVPNGLVDEMDKEEEAVSSKTDRAFRSNEKSLVDNSSGKIHIVNVPTYNGKNVYGWKVVQHEITKYRTLTLDSKNPRSSVNTFQYIRASDEVKNLLLNGNFYSELVKRLSPTINYMVKEFEMRKNATQMARAKVGKSGKINPKRLSRYNMDSDIFQRITSVPQGKNHGLVMYIDLSGSMSSILKKTFEQAVMLTMFCKKVNIPFEVYGFSNHSGHHIYNHTDNFTSKSYNSRMDYSSKNDKDLRINDQDFHLKQYLSSTMPSSAYRQGVENMLFVGFAHQSYIPDLIPPTEYLNGTPLDEAVVSSIDIVSKFKAHNRLDIVNCIFLTDGVGGVTNSYFDHSTPYHYNSFSLEDTVYVQHPLSKERVKYKNLVKDNNGYDGFTSTRALIEIAKNVTGAKYTGYLISDRRSISSMLFQYLYPRISWEADRLNLSALRKNINENGFYSSKMFGFDEYFFVHEENLKVDEKPIIDVGANAKKGVLARAFMKSLGQRGLQRLFLNKFVQNLAA